MTHVNVPGKLSTEVNGSICYFILFESLKMIDNDWIRVQCFVYIYKKLVQLKNKILLLALLYFPEQYSGSKYLFFFKFLIELDPQLIFKKHTENKNYIWTANTFSSFCFQVLPTYFNNPLSVLKGHKQTYSHKVKINKRTKWNDSEFYT